jgi:phospholipase C
MDSLRWGPENDMHPESHAVQLYGVSNVEEGDRLVYRVYSAVRNSPDWDKIMLIIIFDEHGGCYDHVPPPTTIAPDRAFIERDKPGYSGFTFDHLGVRVPAVIVSPFTRAGTILNDVYDHTTVLKTVVECFNLGNDGLGSRAATANGLAKALNLDVARTDSPPIPAPSEPPVGALQKTLALGKLLMQASEKPITALHKASLSQAARRLGRNDLADQAEKATSSLDAEAVAVKLEVELWRRRHANWPVTTPSH